MHAMFFGVKRVYWRTIAVTRMMLKPFGLTPARFDMLRIVWLNPGIAQGTIQWLLGVSAPVVSRMLRSLEMLGLVVRRREDDHRCWFVELTEIGRDTVRAALAANVENHEADRTAARGALGDKTARPESSDKTRDLIERGRANLTAFGSVLAKIRSAFDDGAPFVHPWWQGHGPRAPAS